MYEVMPCNALRTAQAPLGGAHPCTYFRKWGTYHSYDYAVDGAPSRRGVLQEAEYRGRAPLVPELLAGCRKAPIMALGINPNLPGWWPDHRRSMNPLFDDYHQYAHYFRYRAVDKVELSEQDYLAFGGGPHDQPFSTFALSVPVAVDGKRRITLHPQPQAMYQVYQGLLDALATAMQWPHHDLAVGEDLSYGNMVASPSARWTTTAIAGDPELPPMQPSERDGIVTECFGKRRYFPRQLFQSLPTALLIFSQSTANAFIGAFADRFLIGSPQVGEPLHELGRREIRLHYGDLPDATTLQARVIFAPHATGAPGDFAAARSRVIDQLIEEAQNGNLRYNPASSHLARSVGSCVFCTMLDVGKCDYLDELRPLTVSPRLTADLPIELLLDEKAMQLRLLKAPATEGSTLAGWAKSDDAREPAGLRER